MGRMLGQSDYLPAPRPLGPDLTVLFSDVPGGSCTPGVDPGCEGPLQAPDTSGAAPVFTDTVTAKAPGFPWWILLAAGGLVVASSNGSGKRR